uniref:Glycoside hydrolase n=1 Tax=Acrobeloides nanus TaxID=290746 RepID=A0A914E2U8_9BILA
MKKQYKIKTVRIEIEPTSVNQAKTWITEARNNGYNVIATYHKSAVLGSNDANELASAAYWWIQNYENLGADFTINLMNEWSNHNISANDYATAYNLAIRIVRQVYSGRIIIDIPGWGQETKTAADAVKGTYGTKINDTNIVLSTHIYPGGWNQGANRWLSTADLDELASAGRPCIVGEFGKDHGSGGANVSQLVNYAKTKGWTVLAWSWNGDGTGMNMVEPPWSSNSQASNFNLSSYFNVVYPLL